MENEQGKKGEINVIKKNKDTKRKVFNTWEQNNVVNEMVLSGSLREEE